MKLNEIIKLIMKLAEDYPNINSVWEGDVYELNHYEDVKYTAFVVTQQPHQFNYAESYVVYNFNLFYVDRLTADKSNKLQVQSSAVDFFYTLICQLEDNGLIVDDYQVTTFEERFNDVCAGAFLTLAVRQPLNNC